jgi:hypothetical protein
LLSAHVKSSHASTKVHGRYCSAEARCALIESKTISLSVDVVVVVRQPLKKEASTPSHILARVQPHDSISPISWPAYSPDLNPIETVWNRMKDYIMRKYPDYHSSYDRLRTAVKEAWDVIGADELQALVREMPARC